MAAVELLDQAIAAIDKLLSAGGAPKSAGASANGPAAGANTATPPASSSPAPQETKAKPAAPAAPAADKVAKKEEQAANSKKAEKPTAANAGSNDPQSLFSKVLIKVARVLTVDLAENSEKLYKLTIDVGSGEVRQVCAGLRQFLTQEQLKDALVCAVCNLKPAKLAGNLSEAMLLAGEVETAGGLIVRTLIPPAGSQPGDQLYLEGGQPSTDTPKQMKSDHWKAVAGVLRVAGGGKATVDGTPLVTAKGAVTLRAEIPDGSSIH